MRRALLVAAPLSLAVAAPALGGSVTIGSNLKAKANKTQSAPVDSAYWNTRLKAGRVKAPRKGEVSIVRLKGRITPKGEAPPDVVMHVQVLRPIGRGRVQAIVTSGDLTLPFGGDPQRISTYDLQTMPARVCVRRGDYVALSTSGGFGASYPGGAPFRMFARRPGSAFKGFTGAGKDGDGDVFRGRARKGSELLMQIKIATGKSARPTCQ